MRPTNNSTLLTLFLGLLVLCNSVLGATFSARSARARAAASSRRSLLTSGSSHLGKRAKTPPLPSVQDCQARLLVEPDKAVFYVSTVQASADQYAEEKGMVTIHTAGLADYQAEVFKAVDEADANGTGDWEESDEATFFQNASKAFALLASGSVTVIVPEHPNGDLYAFPADSYWTTIEYPILIDSTQNSHVTSIDALKGSDKEVAPTGEPTRLWDRPS